MKRDLAIGAGLVLACVAVFGRTAGFDFVAFDDEAYVTQNPFVLEGLTANGLAWSFFTGYQGMWAPVLWASYMLDVELWGPGPKAFHVVNVALHAVNTVLVYALFTKLTGARGRSAWVALLFALHPLHVESVAWIAGRKDLLSIAFGLAACMAHTTWARRGGLGWHYATFFLYGLALLSKSALVTLPIVLLLLDYWPLGRMPDLRAARRALLEKAPFFVVALGSSAITYFVQHAAGAIGARPTPWAHALGNAVYSTVWYLWKTLWPTGLAVHYPHPFVEGAGGVPLEAWQINGAGLLLLFLTAVLVYFARRPWAAVGWLWYLVVLLPASGVVQWGRHAAADRFTYVPLIGIFVIVAWAGAELAARSLGWRRTVQFFAVVSVAACSVASWQQSAYWRDPFTLFERALEVAPNNSTIHYNLANQLKLKRGDLDGAVEHYRKAVAVQPRYLAAHHNLANTLRTLGDLDGAIVHYEVALALHPPGPGRERAQDLLDRAVRASQR